MPNSSGFPETGYVRLVIPIKETLCVQSKIVGNKRVIRGNLYKDEN